jgi:hypothetical protein
LLQQRRLGENYFPERIERGGGFRHLRHDGAKVKMRSKNSTQNGISSDWSGTSRTVACQMLNAKERRNSHGSKSIS